MRFVHAAMTALCLFTLTASTALAQKVTTDYDKAANFAQSRPTAGSRSRRPAIR